MSFLSFKSRNVKAWSLSAAWLALIVLTATGADAQFLGSGSTGADGALDYTGTPAGTVVVFDPTKLAIPRPAGTNVFNFTTINIPTGVTVKLRGDIISAPIYWLATGDVTIRGTIDLKGQQGPAAAPVLAGRQRSIPGSGGFAGGVGGKCLTTPCAGGEPSAQPGDGPGGGGFYGPNVFAFGNNCPSFSGKGGTNTANSFLVPLTGGSGGAGGNYYGTLAQQIYDGGGGAGGGAILIASSTSIAILGTINADGGAAGSTACQAASGGGAGGSIRLVAPVITGQGTLSALGGAGYTIMVGGNGVIRIEAFAENFAGSVNGPFSMGSPFATFVPSAAPPSVRVISVNGIDVTQPPTANLATPDVAINTSSAVTVTIEAANIPPGTVLTLHVLSDNNTDQTIQTTPLVGTLDSSTASATVTFPSGYSLNYVKATWAQ